MICPQNPLFGGAVHRNTKRGTGGFSLGVLPGVRQDQPRFMTGWIRDGAVRVTRSGTATPSGYIPSMKDW